MTANIVERAFALARSGACQTSRDVITALRSEGFSRYEIDAHLSGRSLSRELSRARRLAAAENAAA